MLFGMKSGHLPASKEDIALAEGIGSGATQRAGGDKGESFSKGVEHPEFVEYMNYAKSLGLVSQR